MAHGSDGHGTHGGVGGYILVAVILAIITYVEFAIVEYDIAWLGSAATLWILLILSVVKFIMVILYFMHLKEDDVAYSGFFASGMAIALGTFVIFALLMTLPHSISFFRAASAPEEAPHAEAGGGHGAEPHGLPDSVLALIESDGYSRELVQVASRSRPKDQGLAFAPPEARTDGFSLASVSGDAAAADSDAGEAEAPAADAQPEEDAVGDEPEAEAAAPEWDPDRGQQVFSRNCASCHQAQGEGVPGAFPPLAGHAAELAVVDGGREYLVDVLLYGLQGPIEVEGTTYDGAMPAWAHLEDGEIADVINFAVRLGEEAEGLPEAFAPLGADEIAERRGEDLSPQDVHDRREALEAP